MLKLLIRWARHDLHRGDLEFLSELTKGFASAERERVRRLSRRGFLGTQDPDGPSAITMRGRAVLWLREL